MDAISAAAGGDTGGVGAEETGVAPLCRHFFLFVAGTGLRNIGVETGTEDGRVFWGAD